MAVLVVALAIIGPLVTFRSHPDAIAYFAIADHWAEGRWAEAVNSYWSPLLSWLLVPWHTAGVPAVVAFKIVNGVAATVALLATRRIAQLAGASPEATTLSSLAVIPFLVYATYALVVPDLLFAALILCYCAAVADPRIRAHPVGAVVVGALGGLAFLAKAIGLPLVLVHLVVVTIVLIRSQDLRRATAWVIAALLTVATVVVPWVVAMSLNYGQVTISAAGSQNLAWMLPGSSGGQPFTPVAEPPTPTAISAWEDPAGAPSAPTSAATPDPQASRDEGGSPGITDIIGNVPRNLEDMVGSLGRGWLLLSLPVAAGGIALLRVPRLDRTVVGVVGAAAVIHVGGTLLSIFEGRYLWWILLAGVASTAPALSALLAARPTAGARATIALVTTLALGLPVVAPLLDRIGHEEPIGVIVADPAAAALLDGRIAADGRGSTTSWLCYDLECQFLGVPSDEQRDDLAATFADHPVDAFVVWSGTVPPELDGCPVTSIADATVEVVTALPGCVTAGPS